MSVEFVPVGADERRAAVALERIADALDDYLEMSLTAAAIARGTDPDITALMKPLLDVIDSIKARRANR